MSNKQAPSYYKALLGLAVIVCLYEAAAKGWVALILIPVSLVVLPLFVWTELAALKHWHARRGVIPRLAIVLMAVLVVAYVTTVGYGDTDNVLLFGFYTVNEASAIAKISNVVSILGFLTAALLWIALVMSIIRDKRLGRKNG